MRHGRSSPNRCGLAVAPPRAIPVLAFALLLAACAAPKDEATALQEQVSADPAAMMRIGEAAEAAQDWAGADTFYKRATELAPDLPSASLAHARMAARQGNLEAALADLVAAHRRHPDDPAIAGALGRMLASAKRPAEALAAFEDGLRAAPPSAPMLVGKGVALDLLERHAEAQAAYAAALAIDRDNAAARKNLALSRAKSRDERPQGADGATPVAAR